jgi:hypothetical protein
VVINGHAAPSSDAAAAARPTAALLEAAAAAALLHADLHGGGGGGGGGGVNGGGVVEFFSSDLPAFLLICLRSVESRAPESVAALSAVNAVLYNVLLSLSSSAGSPAGAGAEAGAGAACMCVPRGLLAEVRKMVPLAVGVAIFTSRYFAVKTRLNLLTASMLHVTNLTPPGSDSLFTLLCSQITVQLMTISMFHVTNLTLPGVTTLFDGAGGIRHRVGVVRELRRTRRERRGEPRRGCRLSGSWRVCAGGGVRGGGRRLARRSRRRGGSGGGEVSLRRRLGAVPVRSCAPAGLALSTTLLLCAKTPTVRLMTASVFHVTNLTPGSVCNPTRRASCAPARQLAFEALACLTTAAVSASPHHRDAKEDNNNNNKSNAGGGTSGGGGTALAFPRVSTAAAIAAVAPFVTRDAESRRLLKLVRAAVGLCTLNSSS